jgi:hypothetical protein
MGQSGRDTRSVGRRAYLAVVAFYCLLFAALVWPVYPLFATIEPRILAMPHSMAYVVGALLLSYMVLGGLYWLERDNPDDTADDERAAR